MKKKEALQANGGVPPPVVPTPRKCVHEKKTRPNMKGKHKIRMGMQSADIYEGFEDKKGVAWTCPNCNKVCRTVGFCVACSISRSKRKEVDAPPPQIAAAASNPKKVVRDTSSKKKKIVRPVSKYNHQ